MTDALLLVYTSVADGRDDEYSEWYTEHHFPEMLALPGFVGARRFRVAEPFAGEADHRYLTIYEIEGDPSAALAAVKAARAEMTPTDLIVGSGRLVVEALGEWVR